MSDLADIAEISEMAPEAICENANLIAAAERQIAMLRQIAEHGMDVVREISRCAKAASDGDGARDAAEAFAKVTRAIRLTFAMEMKTLETLRALIAGETLARETRRQAAADRVLDAERQRRAEAEERIEDLVKQVIIAETEDLEAYKTCVEALQERLDEDEAYSDRLDRPLREVVEQLCKDLDLTPDWSRWTGEGWAPDADGRPFHSRFKQPSRTPADHPSG